MTARGYLNQYKVLSKALEDEKMTLLALNSSAERMTTSYCDTPVQMIPHERALEKNSTAVMMQKELISKLESDREEIFHEIRQNIIQFGNKGAGVLVHYYINDLTLEAIGITCGHKSRQWALDRKKEGERMIQKAMEEHPDSFHLLDLSSKYAELYPERKPRKKVENTSQF